MSLLERRVEDALLDLDPRQSEHRVKETVADALAAFDPSMKLTVTSYFNHTFAPDMVMSWGKVERPVFLRFTDNVLELGHDIDLLDELDPLVFGLSTPPDEEVAENRLDERSRVADVFLTTPAAVDELTSRPAPAATDRMVRNSLAHGGRGALVASDDAGRLADTVEAGLGSAAAGQVEGTRQALATIDHYFGKGQASRLNRVVQAVWEGGGSRLDQFPGEADLTSDVGVLSLVYLLQFMDTDDAVFWRGVGRGLSLDQTVELARADAVGGGNFQHLVNANLDVLRARACMVLDMTMMDDPRSLRWAVDLPALDLAPALTLRGPAFHAFVTRSKDELVPRLGKPGPGLPVDDYVKRTSSAQVAAVNVSVGGKHISLSDDSGTTESEFLQAATSALPSAQVDKATVTTPSGRVTVDFPQGTGTGVTRSDNLVADLVLATTNLLVPLAPEQHEALSQFLHVTDRSQTTADESSDTLPFDHEDMADEDTPIAGDRR